MTVQGKPISAADGPGVPLRAARKVLVCIDYEGQWGMPFAASYDLTASTHRLLESLERHGAHATFFAVGALALERPELIKDISSAGHEIAVHGWRHEHLDRLTGPELAVFGQGLAEADTAIESVTGRRPGGFRAPYLLGPIFFDSAVYDLLADRGYRWTSNRELRHVIELLRPNRLKTDRPWRLAQSRSSTFTGVAAQLFTLALNASVWRNDRLGGSTRSAIRWLRSGCPPFYRGSLLEIPLYSPMDCDLLGLPEPSEPTAESLLDFARFSLLSTLSQSRPFTMLTFHDWIIAGGNRLSLFDQLLSSLHELGVQAVTVEECWPELTASAALPHDSFQLHERSTA